MKEDDFIHEDAKLAVKRGINWLDDNHPGWVHRINLDGLNMAECRRCVIGQAVGEYTVMVARASGSDMMSNAAVDWAVEHGFESPVPQYLRMGVDKAVPYHYRELDTLWSDEVRNRLG